MNEHTVEGPTVKRLERSRSDRMLAGVCGGLASYFEIHPAFYRVGFVVLTLLGGAGILIYIAAALVMPDEGKTDSVASAALRDRRDRPWPLIGLALLAVGGAVLLSRVTFWPDGDVWLVLLVVGAAILWITRHGADSTAADATGAETGDAATVSERAARDSRRIGRFFRAIAITLGALLALLLISAAIFAAVVHVHIGRGIGDRNYEVAGLQDLRDNYRLGIGDLRVDMSDVQLPVGETHVDARVDVGELELIVPEDAALEIHGDADLGQVELLGSADDGRNVDKTYHQEGARRLVLDLHVGVGAVHVRRAVR